jgi:hypothetical protein
MTTAVESPDVEHVACEMCLKEVPRSEAAVPEATDYVVYFCGLDCYQEWKKQRDKANGQDKGSSS